MPSCDAPTWVDAHETAQGLLQSMERVRETSFAVLRRGIGLLRLLEEGMAPSLKPKAMQALHQRIAHLEELQRLHNEQDLLLAVTGVMKAGKSTTINALVGMEVLPTRNMPMTAVPTRIKHRDGATTPLLQIPNVKIWQDVLRQLQPHLLESLRQNPDTVLQPVLHRIAVWDYIPRTMEGCEPVRETLSKLHDIVRWSDEVGIAFPYDAFKTLEALPLVEVAFSHWPEAAILPPEITLLDTPGGNEAGGRGFKTLALHWLTEANGLLLVTDYTQLKSEAEAELYENIANLPADGGKRVYILVNRFDQQTSASLNAPSVCDLVYGISRRLQPLLVHATAAQLAQLADKAAMALSQDGQLPVDQESWVSDFGEKAFGRQWEKDIADVALLRRAIAALHKDSGLEGFFSKMLLLDRLATRMPQEVIKACHQVLMFLIHTAEHLDIHAGTPEPLKKFVNNEVSFLKTEGAMFIHAIDAFIRLRVQALAEKTPLEA